MDGVGRGMVPTLKCEHLDIYISRFPICKKSLVYTVATLFLPSGIDLLLVEYLKLETFCEIGNLDSSEYINKLEIWQDFLQL